MKKALIKFLQKRIFKVSNSFNAKEPSGSRELESGVTFLNDICYGTQHPNSFLDMYVLPDAKTVSHPTFFMVHGGAYTWGDKNRFHPNTEAFWYISNLLLHQFNIVTINYALIPEYVYPTPIIQMGEAIEFLQKSGSEYGLDMTRIIFWGSSAGGHIIGQFANIQTNPAYAAEMNIKPVLDKSFIKSMIFNSTKLVPERIEKPDSRIVYFVRSICRDTYYQTKKLKGNQNVIQANVIHNISTDFPPTFISDANWNSFYEQALEFKKELSKFNIPHQLNYYPPEVQKLNHGFETKETKYGKENMEKMLIFLKTKVG